jgi:hypothetical protein
MLAVADAPKRRNAKRRFITEDLANKIKEFCKDKTTEEIKAFAQTFAEENNIHLSILRSFIEKNGIAYFDYQLKRTKPWRDEELQVLENYAGFIPFKSIVKKIHQINFKNLEKCRTPVSIRKKLAYMGLDARCDGEYYTLSELSRLLGCSKGRMMAWAKNPKIREILKPDDDSAWQRVHRENIKKFIVEYRQEIATCKPELEWMLSLFVDD